MPLTICDQTFSGKLTPALTQQIIDAIKALPLPNVTPMTFIPSNKLGLSLHREFMQIDKTDPENKIEYMGTKNLGNDFYVLIDGEQDSFGVHIHPELIFDFVKALSKFKHKENLSISIVGGEANEESEKALQDIIRNLYVASQLLNVSMRIKTQRIMEAHVYKAGNELENAYDAVLGLISRLAKNFYDQSIPESFLADHDLSSIKQRQSGLNEEDFQLFHATLLCRAASTVNDDQKNMLKTHFLKKYSSFELFLQGLHKYFTISALNQTLKSPIASCSSLPYFVINLRDNSVTTISAITPTPHEIERDARLAVHGAANYYSCYDATTRKYLIPEFPSIFLARCSNIRSGVFIQPNTNERDNICETLGLTADARVIDSIIEFLKSPASFQDFSALRSDKINSRLRATLLRFIYLVEELVDEENLEKLAKLDKQARVAFASNDPSLITQFERDCETCIALLLPEIVQQRFNQMNSNSIGFNKLRVEVNNRNPYAGLVHVRFADKILFGNGYTKLYMDFCDLRKHLTPQKALQFGGSTGEYLQFLKDIKNFEVMTYENNPTAVSALRAKQIPHKEIDLSSITENGLELSYKSEIETDMSEATNVFLIRILRYIEVSMAIMLLHELIRCAKPGTTFFVANQIGFVQKFQTKNFILSFFGPRTDFDILEDISVAGLLNEKLKKGEAVPKMIDLSRPENFYLVGKTDDNRDEQVSVIRKR